MKFRNRQNRRVAEAVVEFKNPSEEAAWEAREPGRGRWSTAFLMAGSALLGATAIAFWNRRTIATMRAQIQAAPEPSAFSSVPLEDDIY